jgi:hypothetical protein
VTSCICFVNRRGTRRLTIYVRSHRRRPADHSLYCACCRSIFCVLARLARISAAIQSSKVSSANHSNQRACLLASAPTRALIPCAARSR